MLYCQVCCEPFHQFCLEPAELPSEENKENWCCRRCKFCHVCGRKNKHSKVRPANLTCFTYILLLSINVVQSVSITLFMSISAIVGVWTMPELLSCFLSGTQLSKTKQEEESLGRFTCWACWGWNTLITGPNIMVSVQVCMTCIRCKSCGVTPGKSWDIDWNHDKGLCPDCSILYELGEGRMKPWIHLSAPLLSTNITDLCWG